MFALANLVAQRAQAALPSGSLQWETLDIDDVNIMAALRRVSSPDSNNNGRSRRSEPPFTTPSIPGQEKRDMRAVRGSLMMLQQGAVGPGGGGAFRRF